MTVWSRASAGITARYWYQFWGQPCTSSSGGPSPPMTTCWRSPPALTNRLLNVLPKPGGRCGASGGRVAAKLVPASAPESSSERPVWRRNRRCMGSLHSRMWLADRAERVANLAREHLRHLPGGEVAAGLRLVEVDEAGERAACPRLGRPEEVVL